MDWTKSVLRRPSVTTNANRLTIVGVAVLSLAACGSDVVGGVTPPRSASYDAWCLTGTKNALPESDCEWWGDHFYDMLQSMDWVNDPGGLIVEDDIEVYCSDLVSQHSANVGAEKMTEYLGSLGTWDSRATQGADGLIMKRSYLQGNPGSYNIYELMLHELRHNLGHSHGDAADYNEVSSGDAAETCVGISLAEVALASKPNFASISRNYGMDAAKLRSALAIPLLMSVTASPAAPQSISAAETAQIIDATVRYFHKDEIDFLRRPNVVLQVDPLILPPNSNPLIPLIDSSAARHAEQTLSLLANFTGAVVITPARARQCAADAPPECMINGRSHVVNLSTPIVRGDSGYVDVLLRSSGLVTAQDGRGSTTSQRLTSSLIRASETMLRAFVVRTSAGWKVTRLVILSQT